MRKLKSFICILLSLFCCVSCNKDEKTSNTEEKGNTQELSVKDSEKYFVHEELVNLADKQIYNVTFFEDDIYYYGVGDYKNINNEVLVGNVNDGFQKKDSIYFSHVNSTGVHYDKEISYIIYNNKNNHGFIGKYDSVEKKMLLSLELGAVSVDSLTVNRQGNIVVFYSDENDKYISFFDSNLQEINKIVLDKGIFEENEHVYYFEEASDGSYYFRVNDGQDHIRRIVKLNSEFGYEKNFDHNELLGEEEYFCGFVLTKQDTILLCGDAVGGGSILKEYGITDGIEYEEYFIDKEILSVFKGIGKYDFVYVSYDGVFGYVSKDNKSELLYLSEDIVDLIAITDVQDDSDDNILLLYTKVNVSSDEISSSDNDFPEDFQINYDTSSGKYIRDMLVKSENEFYFLYSDDENEKYDLVKTDAAGNVIFSEIIDGKNRIVNRVVLSDSYVNLLISDISEEESKDSILRFDINTGKNVDSVDSRKLYSVYGYSEQIDMYMMIEDLIATDNCIYYLYLNNICRFDFETQTASVLKSNVFPGSQLLNIIEGYDICWYDDNGIYGCAKNNDESVMLVDWEKCDEKINLKKVNLISEDEFCVYGVDRVKNNYCCYKYIYADSDYMEKMNEKTEVVVAVVNSGYSNKITDSIHDINNDMDKDITVKLKEYHSIDEFNKAMVSDELPDLVLSYGNTDFSNLDIFMDLTDYFKNDKSIDINDYYDNILHSGKDKSKIEQIIPEYSIMCLFGKESILGKTRILTNEEYSELVRNPSTEYTVYPYMWENIFDYILVKNLNQFINYEEKICKFENQIFCEMLDDIRLVLSSDNESYELNEALKGNISSIDVCEFSSFYELEVLSQMFLGETLSLVGLPGEDEWLPIINPKYSFGILEKSKCPDEAWEFIKYFLEDDYQNSTEAFPLKCSAYEYHKENLGNSINDDIRYEYINSDKITEIEEFIKSAKNTTFRNKALIESIDEEICNISNENITIDETLDNIEYKVNLYLYESE
ncbi:MAG: hypothetical protein E7510_13905 [Ruminococcus sp.]|nr:hypothetical protein [Ruminococcus sp.]